MKLTDFSAMPRSEYNWLKQHLDELGDLKPYILDNIQLSTSCSPARTCIGFYKNSGSYAIYSKNHIRYTGTNNNLRSLFGSKEVKFSEWDKLVTFCKGFKNGSPNSAQPTTNESASDGSDDITDWSEIKIPEKDKPQDNLSFEAIKQNMQKVIIGQDDALDTVCYQVSKHLKKKNPKRPLSLLAFGPPGIGKSETANNLANVLTKLTGKNYTPVWTDLNTFTEAHSVYRLIGAPPSYIGYEDKPIFEAVAENPYTVFIFDELDKAHPQVLKTFMAVLDDGRCASRKRLSNGKREFDFRHCIIFFTSNFDLSNDKGGDKPKIGFNLSDTVDDISYKNDSVEVKYNTGDDSKEDASGDNKEDLVTRIYENTERARRKFIECGVLREIASRFQGFVEYKPLSTDAKVRILAKQIIETGFEYGLRIGYISKDIIQGIIDSMDIERGLTVRSFKSVIEGRLVDSFTEIEPESDDIYKLEGDINDPILTKM